MMGWTIGIFAVAAAGGATTLVMAWKQRTVPMSLALLHGALAATALVLLAIRVLGGGAGELAAVSLAVFVLAALGGFVLFVRFARTLSPAPGGRSRAGRRDRVRPAARLGGGLRSPRP